MIVVLVLAEIVFRPLGHSLYFTEEYSQFLMAWLIFFALGEVTRRRSHITADFFVRLLPAGAQRWLEAGVATTSLVLYVTVLLWLTFGLALTSLEDGLRSQGLMRTPMAIPQFGMVVGMVILLLRGVVNMVDAMRVALRGTPPRRSIGSC